MIFLNFISTVFFCLITGIQLLSLFKSIDRLPIVIVLVFSVLISFSIFYRRFNFRRIHPFLVQTQRLLSLFYLILLLLIFQSLVYPPNNWDSMTYHMSRIVYWMNNHTIDYFPTVNLRKNLLSPGAELLIMVPQVLFYSDRFANLLQTFGFALIFFSNLYSVKLLNPSLDFLSRFFISFLSVMFPMALLQASSTQNDLIVSGFLCLSVANLLTLVKSSKNFLNWFQLAVTVSLTYLIKPTGFIVILPIALYIVMKNFRKIFVRNNSFLYFSITSIIFISFILPDAFRKYENTGSFLGNRQEVFGFFDPISLKLFTAVKAFFYHTPFSSFCTSEVYLYVDSRVSSLGLANLDPCLNSSMLHEDYAGNLVQILLLLFFAIYFIPAVLYRRRRNTVFLIIPLVTWILFHMFIRDQVWISRLHTPIFAIMPLSFVAIKNNAFDRTKVLVIWLLFLNGIYCILNNQSRPLLNWDKLIKSRDLKYYENNSELSSKHLSAVTLLQNSNCRALGLILGEDSWDYPLIWNAHKLGFRFSEILEPKTYRDYCLIYSDSANFSQSGFRREGNLFVRQN